MALSNFIPTLWTARFLSKLRDNLVWGSVMNSNYEGEVRSAGDTVRIPTSTTSITVKNYTESTDIAAAEQANGTTQDLVIDKQKYFHFYVDDIHEVQTLPNLMDDAMGEAAYQMADQMDDDFKATYIGGYDATRNVTPTYNANEDTFVPAILRAFTQQARVMDEANLPRAARYAIIGPKLLELLTNRFAISGGANAVFTPNLSESNIRNGFVGDLLGFRLLVTNKQDTVDIGGKAHDRIWLGVGTEANTRAMQITEVETYRPQLRFGDAVKGLNVYGSKQVLPARLYTISMRTEA